VPLELVVWPEPVLIPVPVLGPPPPPLAPAPFVDVLLLPQPAASALPATKAITAEKTSRSE
jgi:hypothetical protein